MELPKFLNLCAMVFGFMAALFLSKILFEIIKIFAQNKRKKYTKRVKAL